MPLTYNVAVSHSITHRELTALSFSDEKHPRFITLAQVISIAANSYAGRSKQQFYKLPKKLTLLTMKGKPV